MKLIFGALFEFEGIHKGDEILRRFGYPLSDFCTVLCFVLFCCCDADGESVACCAAIHLRNLVSFARQLLCELAPQGTVYHHLRDR